IQPAAVEAYSLADDGEEGVGGFSPFELEQARRTRIRRRSADGGNQWKALGQFRADRYPDLRTRLLCKLADRLLELRGPEIAGGPVDEIAHERGRFGESYPGVDPRNLAHHENAGAALLLVLPGPIVIERVLAEQPAKRGLAGFAFRKLVGAFRQA